MEWINKWIIERINVWFKLMHYLIDELMMNIWMNQWKN